MEYKTGGKLNRRFLTGLAALGLAIGALGLAACGAQEPTPSSATEQPAEQPPAEEVALSNEAAIQIALDQLAISSGTVKSFPPETFGGAADDAQRKATITFFVDIQEAQTQIMDAEIQIANENSGEDIIYSKTGLDNLRQQVATATEITAQFEQKYNTQLLDDKGNWLASDEYLAAHPEFITMLSDYSTIDNDPQKSYWNFRDKTPMRIFTDPNTGKTIYFTDMPENANIKVSAFEPSVNEATGQPNYLDVSGAVIELGDQEIKNENGELDAKAPDLKYIIVDKENVTMEELASSGKYYYDFITGENLRTDNPDLAKKVWMNSREGLAVGANWGSPETVGMVVPKGMNVCDYSKEKNSNSIMDASQFEVPSPDYNDGVCFNGNAFIKIGSASGQTSFAYFTWVSRKDESGKIPELNNPEVRQALVDYANSIAPSTVSIDSAGVVTR